jgi:murein DD-endopeptidase MepM/ murein hydrolase activator NlpD
MDKKSKRDRYYTFMVIPHDARGRTFCIKIPMIWVYTALGLAVFSTVVVGSSIIYSSFLSRRLVYYYKAIAKNREQKKIIDSFAQETKRVNQAIAELEKEDNNLRKILGLKSWKRKIKLSSEANDKTEKISEDFKLVDAKISERRKSLEDLKEWVHTVRKRFASTPSRWPVNGRIVSRFGYRVYPWRGFHTGVDISGSYGAPVRATADGVVSFVGWRRGYGRTVTLSHIYGASTLYAHCSKFTVKSGQRVKKGQIISYVGNTGYATGPHLHYEVRKSSRPINPVAYLNLNILSASKIWTLNQ